MKNTHAVTDETFADEVLKSPTPVLVDFWAPWCGPCQMIGPILEELGGEYSGRAKVVKINVDENQQVAGSLGVRGIPALFYFKNGRVVDQVVGAAGKGALAARLDAVIAS